MKTEERTYKEKVRKERREKAGTISDKDKTLKIDGSWMIMRNGSKGGYLRGGRDRKLRF